MKLASLSGARAAYYDRNATTVSGNYIATVGPHASTVRFTYTCPSGRKAYIEAATSHVLRATAATTAGGISVFIGTSTIRATDHWVVNNTVNYFERQVQATVITIYAGGVYSGTTNDGSTGGTVDYNLQMTGTEFDA
jgi:hypothetical protein